MKKIILTLALVFSTGALMNAKTTDLSIQNYSYTDECDEVYNQVRDVVTAITGSLHTGIMAAIRAEEVCLDSIVEIIE